MAKLNPGGWNGECDVETVVYEQPGRRAGGQSRRELVVLESAQRAPARVKREVRPAADGEGARDVVEISTPGDPLVGDGVQSR